MKNFIAPLLCLFFVMALAPLARAEEWAVIGTRQMGMGGAGVATTRGSLSTYWNPAGLAPPKAPRLDTSWDMGILFSVNAGAPGDVLPGIDDIADSVSDLGDFDALAAKLSDPGQTLTDQELQEITRLVAEEIPSIDGKGQGLVSNATVGAAVRAGRFGFSALGLASAGGVTEVDLVNLALGDQGIGGAIGAGNDRTGQLSGSGQTFADNLFAAGLGTQNQVEEVVFQAEQSGVAIDDPGAQQNIQALLQATQDNIGGDPDAFFTENTSGVNIRGIVVQEYAVAYAHPFFEIVSVGVSGKLLYGSTFFEPFTLDRFEDTGDLLDDLYDFDSNDEQSVNFGVDVGILVQPLRWLSLGVVGRNLNRPRFDFNGPGDYTLEPQIRGGVGVAIPGTGVLFAVDADIVENNSEALLDYESHSIAGGVEWTIFDAFSLRAGASNNVAESTEGIVLHAGFGFHMPYVSIEAAASVSPDFTEVNGNDVPERASAGLFVGINIPLD